MRDLPISPRPSAALLPLLLPLLATCGGVKDGAEACESLMTALCAAGEDDTCGLGGPTAGACVDWNLAKELELPALTAEAAEACVELLEAPECDSPSWAEDVERCLQLPEACVRGEGSDWVSGEDTGLSWRSIDSCDWLDAGICFEFEGYDGARDWCSEVAQAHQLSSSFYPGVGCPSDGMGPCVYPAGGDFPVSVIAYYFGVGGAQFFCESAGGAWRG
jgi:hypothetical protein